MPARRRKEQTEPAPPMQAEEQTGERRPRERQPLPARRSDRVPAWVVVFVVVVGGFAVSLPLFMASFIFGLPFASSGNSAGSFFTGEDRLEGAQFFAIDNASAAEVLPECSDSDGGVNLAVRGTCSDGFNVSTDYCWNNASVVEFQCLADRCVQNLVNCLAYNFTGCRDGACVKNQTNQSLPDLTFRNISASLRNSTNGTIVFISATAINSGSAPAGPSTTRFSIYPSIGLDQLVPTPSLAVNQIATLSASIPWNGLATNASAHIDVYNVVQESNENNNILDGPIR